ncbi:MAG: ATP-grasp domain-containing protein [Lentisphaeria bacterium]|jgi:D-alanine-D-alanine ligase
MLIGLTYDLRQDYLALGYSELQVAEFDEERTIAALDRTIQELGHRTDRIGHAKKLCERLVKGDRWDLVFNIAEGVAGRNREAQVPALLDLYGIPHTFADALVCATTLDKAVAKRIVQACGLRTPAFAVVRTPQEAAAVKLRYPLFAKPVAEGTGKGVTGKSRVATPAELAPACQALFAEFAQPVLVEEYLPGREFTVAVLGTGSRARALGTMEIHVQDSAGSGIYSHDNKENWEGRVRYSSPARDAFRAAIEKLAVDCYVALECRDAGRVDIRLDADGQPSFMEVNPLAGLNPGHSDLPLIAEREDLSYRDLIGAILDSAKERL